MDTGVSPQQTIPEQSGFTQPSTVESRRQKSPGMAFAMSLVLPGSGQLYCGKRRGIWTFIFFTIGAVAAYAMGFPKDRTTEFLWGMCARTAIALYAFSFLDAYFTAREVNRGIDIQIDGANPRVAAILNLLTKGFGYFYLGQRKLGITVFILLSVLTRGAQRAPEQVSATLGVILEVVLAILAFHAWRLAHKEVDDILKPVSPDPSTSMDVMEERGLRPVLPLALGGLFALNYALLVSLGFLAPDYTKVDQATASITTADDGTSAYKNSAYGVQVAFPAGWTVKQGTTEGTFVEAEKYEGLCNMQLMAAAELFPTTGDDEAILAELRKSYPKTYLAGMQPSKLGGIDGNEVLVTIPIKEDVELQQRYVLVRRRLKLDAFSYIATYGGDNECISEAEEIRKSIVLPR